MKNCVYRENDVCLKNLTDCDNCRELLCLDDKKFLKKWSDPLKVLDRRRNPASDTLRGMLAGASVFLIGGGPSANDLPLELLNTRGIWSMCVNNMAGHGRFRPQAMVCSDPPSKFSHSVWLDPGIMKFIPIPKLGGRRAELRIKKNGEFEKLDRKTCDCPNVWGFHRNSYLWPDERFFMSAGACWGNHQEGVEKTGQPKTVCTLLLGIRLLHFLGASRIYLVGVDFYMGPEYGYSFGQGRTDQASQSNNQQFAVVNKWLCEMQQNGVFSKFGLSIFNCNNKSGLRAFPHAPFERAITQARGQVETLPDLVGWYEK